MDIRKRIALVTYGKQKRELIQWVAKNAHKLRLHRLYAMGIMAQLMSIRTGLPVNRLHSRQLGGYLQLMEMMANGEVDILVLFWDAATSPSEDGKVLTLLRLAAMHNVVVTCNEAGADFMLNSPLLEQTYLPEGADAIGALELITAESAYCDAG
jgi:methylglyoxal synthase